MSGEVLVRESDKKAVLAYTAGNPGWHKLGQPVPEGSTVTEFLKAAEAGKIRVEKRGLWEQTADGLFVPYTKRMALKRLPYDEEPKELNLGEVAPDYEPVQNVDLARYLEHVGKHAPCDVMGVLFKGAVTFFTFKGEAFEILVKTGKRGKGKADVQVLYLLVLHDMRPGNAIKFILSPVRPVCANTTRAAEAQAMWQMSISHNAGANDMAEWVAEVMGNIASRQKALAQAMQSMADTRLDDEGVVKFIQHVIPVGSVPELVKFGQIHFGDRTGPEGLADDQLKRWEAYQARLKKHEEKVEHNESMRRFALAAYQESPTQAALVGTVYGAYNAALFAIDHFEDTERNSRVAASNMTGYRADYKVNAWKEAVALTRSEN